MGNDLLSKTLLMFTTVGAGRAHRRVTTPGVIASYFYQTAAGDYSYSEPFSPNFAATRVTSDLNTYSGTDDAQEV